MKAVKLDRIYLNILIVLVLTSLHYYCHLQNFGYPRHLFLELVLVIILYITNGSPIFFFSILTLDYVNAVFTRRKINIPQRATYQEAQGSSSNFVVWNTQKPALLSSVLCILTRNL